MKKVLILIILNICILNAQDSEPELWEFRWGYSNDLRIFNPDSVKQTSFLTGFQWGGSTQMNNALQNNVWTGGDYNVNPISPIRKLNLILQPKWQDKGYYNPGYFYSPFLQYEPTLPLDGTNEGTILRLDDESDPVFGFRNRIGTILDTPTDPNFSRLVLKKDSSYVGDTVLSDIWPQPNFKTITWEAFKKYGQTDKYLGRKWYITINLRRLNPSVDTIINDDGVLNLKLPYETWGGANDTIQFNQLPKNDHNYKINYDTAAIGERGNYQKMESVVSPTKDFLITNRMLPISVDTSNITISAEFYTNDNQANNNPQFAENDIDLDRIKSIDIQAQYWGNLDIAIDWIRLESASANILLKGLVDSIPDAIQGHKDGRGFRDFYIDDIESETIANYDDVTDSWFFTTEYHFDRKNSIYTILQTAIDTLKVETNVWADAELFRFNFQDTENDSYYWWGPLRYCNKFANGMFMTRDGLQNPRLYNYYTKSPNKWLGVGLSSSDREIPAPYAINTERDNNSMHLDFGYLGAGGDIHFGDTLNSDFETHLMNYNPSVGHPAFVADWEDLDRDSYYFDSLLISDDVIQSRFEGQAYEHYYKNTFKSSFLFSEIQWFQYNLFYNYRLNYDSIADRNYFTMHYYRPKTAEEMRLINSSVIIMGCKGIISDGDRNKVPPDISPGNMGIGDNTKLNENNDIYSDSVGTDFIDAKFDVWQIRDSVDLVKIAENWRVDTSRVYIGTKSYRAELFEEHSFIRANDDLLMNLRLAAAMSKGFRKHYTQDYQLYGSDTLLNSFIDLNESNTFTSKLPGSTNEFIYPEPFDSSFVDITLLREFEKPIDSVFYIGVLNRRTDPLFLYPAPYDSNSYLRFFSSAEFRDSCMNSPDSLVYQSYWWKRQGARRVTIPFDYKFSDVEDYKLLRISEIGSNVDSLNSLWHRGEKYYDMVTDTVIGQDRSLSFNLLPGQGKILKVEALKSDIVEGFLDNYNQNKFVEYRDPLDSNKIIYHLAFYKNSIRPDDTTNIYKEVHYIRSFPIKRNSQSENIIWDSTSRVNLSKLFFESLPIVPPKYDDCNHPALVVREDSSGLPHPYIVYTCKDSAATGSGKGRVILAKVSPYGGSVVSNKEIFRLSFNDIERFGTPTINASADGNYIAWTDSLRGLFVAYQKKDENTITDIDSIRKIDFSNVTPKSILYPSFNTYSHIENGENNAGLVWYQADLTSGRIFYSRVSFDAANDTVVLNVPGNYAGESYFFKDVFSRMMRVSQYNIVNENISKPIIYRNLSNYTVTGVPWCQYNRYDNINWIEPQSASIFSLTKIAGVTLYHRDSFNTNQSWSSSKINEIKFSGLQKDVIVNSINSAQQDGIIMDTTELEVGGNFNLNFTVDSAAIYQMPGFNGSNFLKRKLFGYEANYPMVSPQRASYGNMVQLAKSKKPNFNENFDMWKNRRVFESDEKDSLGNPIIKSSAHLFYKAAHTETIPNHVFYGFTGDSNNVYFDLPKFEGDPSTISSFPIALDTYPNRLGPCPLLLDDYAAASFIMPGLIFKDANSDGEKEMEISIYGHMNSDISVILERAYDSAQVVLTMPPLTPYPSGAVKLVYSILDSTTSEFNLIFQNNDTTAFYNEKAFIGGLANVDTINYKSAIEKNPVKYIIDFNNGGVQYEAKNINDFELTVYPNPTSGNLRVQAFLLEKLDGYKIENRSLVVTVYDATGRKVLSQNGATGQMFELDLSNSPTGAYIVTVTHNEGNKTYTATERIVKE